uniref:Uncharacterized protein n=1 Tax=Tanacetum cinerariifolium TaxID=118510 RepID=A0A699H6T2_TANCI|nr:hypothetical protein [Tanacetum cinerariifolium]
MTINEPILDVEEAAIRLDKMLSADEQRQKNEREKQKAIVIKKEIDKEVDKAAEFEVNELKRIKTNESDGDDDEAKGFNVNSRNEKMQTPFFPHYSTHKTYHMMTFTVIYMRTAPTFQDIGLLGDVGMPGLISYDGSTGKEKPLGESYDPN